MPWSWTFSIVCRHPQYSHQQTTLSYTTILSSPDHSCLRTEKDWLSHSLSLALFQTPFPSFPYLHLFQDEKSHSEGSLSHGKVLGGSPNFRLPFLIWTWCYTIRRSLSVCVCVCVCMLGAIRGLSAWAACSLMPLYWPMMQAVTVCHCVSLCVATGPWAVTVEQRDQGR